MGTVEEAANQLLDKESPPASAFDSVSDFFTGIFGACGLRATRHNTYYPGAYEIVGVPAVMENSSANPMMMAGDWRVEVGTRVELVEIKVDHAQQVIRGRRSDGRWVCIASTS